jgi:hypothetical protein
MPIKKGAPMGPGLLPAKGSISSAANTLTARSSTNRNPSFVPGSRPLDQITGKATSGLDSSADTLIDESKGLLSMTPLKGMTTAASELKRK